MLHIIESADRVGRWVEGGEEAKGPVQKQGGDVKVEKDLGILGYVKILTRFGALGVGDVVGVHTKT